MIEIKDFSFWYPGYSQPVLDNISLTVVEGETVLLIGPSGCGKSTLLLAMNGVVPYMTGGKVKGRVYVDGADTRQTPIAELAATVGLILQDPESQLSNLYVFDEVAFGPENLVLPEDEIITRSNQALEKSGLAHLKERSVFALSGGQKQRVAIAASLAMLPRIILLDNPTSNLDPVGASETYNAIRELRHEDKKLTIILADHRPDHVIDIVDRIVVMDKGKIVADGAPREILSENGKSLKNELGIFLPQIADLALQFEEQKYPLPSLPLTLDEAFNTIPFADVRFSQPESKAPVGTDAEDAVILDLENVQFAYPSGVQAVNGVDLEVRSGEFLCLVGQNGSGKTTLAKLMVGLLKATQGEITFFDQEIREMPLEDLIGRVGYVFQYPEHQFIKNNVYDEIAFSLRALKIDEDEIKSRTEEMIDLFSLQDVRSLSPLMLSKGQKRRLSVATMLVTQPDVLILDEPMTGQDQKNINSLLEILNRLREKGTTIIDISHDMEHVASYASRVVGMANGKVIFDGEPDVLFQKDDVLAQLSLEPPPVVKIVKRLASIGINLPADTTTATKLFQYVGEGEG